MIQGKLFDGVDIVPQRDNARLSTQLDKIKRLMRDGKWRTLDEISSVVNAPPASVSAQLRNLRKDQFGNYDVQRKHIGKGLYNYRISRS